MKRFGEKAVREALANGATIRAWDWYTASAGYRVIINDETEGYIVSDLFSKLLRDGTIEKTHYAFSYTDYAAAQPAQDAETETETENQTDAENAADGAQEDENTMNENNETRNALDENTAHCKHIAQDIERIADGGIYMCPECGEMVTMTETEDADGFTAYELSCGHTVEYAPDSVTFYEYFSDVFDIEYRIGGDREYRSVKLMVACGGPNIYIDTARRAVLLYWWTDRAEYPISTTAADEIDNVFSEIFEM